MKKVKPLKVWILISSDGRIVLVGKTRKEVESRTFDWFKMSGMSKRVDKNLILTAARTLGYRIARGNVVESK